MILTDDTAHDTIDIILHFYYNIFIDLSSQIQKLKHCCRTYRDITATEPNSAQNGILLTANCVTADSDSVMTDL